MSTIPTLRPLGRHKAYYDELRAFQGLHGAALLAEAAALKVAKRSNGHKGLSLADCLRLALRYRLKLAALFTLLEDGGLIPVGTYDRLKDSNIAAYADGSPGRFAPMRLLAEYIEAHGLPEAAPGCEEVGRG